MKVNTYPLLQSQLGVLLQSMQHPESTQYNLPNYIIMPLTMKMERVASAAQMVLQSFPELHTRFVAGEQGEVRQWCDMSMTIPVVSRKCTEAELQAYLSEGFIRPFDLFGSEPLFRVEVIETEERLYLLSDGHHAIVDGMSFAPILTSAFAKIYEGETLEVPSYGMYQAAEDEVASFGTEAYQRAKDYYAQKFAGLEMATLSHSPYGTMGAMGRSIATVSRQACDDWCREHGLQANLLFQAAFSHVLSVLTRQQQVAYAAVNHGRMDKRLRNTIGMFVKSVPILVDADPTLRVVDFLKSLRGELMSTIRYGIYPFTHFCSDLGMKPGILFNFLALADMEEHVMLSDGEMRAEQPVRKEIDSDLSVDIYLRGESYEIRVQSSLAMNDEATLHMVAEAVRVAVNNMIAHPDATLGELDLVSDEERDALIQLGTGERLDFDHSDTLVSLFRRQAAATPDATAVVFGDRRMTYRELDRLTDRLACHLINKYKVQPEEAVGVMIDRSELMVVYPLAIMKAGGCYMPLDFSFPADRLQYMCEDAGVRLILSERLRVGDGTSGMEDRVANALPTFKGQTFLSEDLSALPEMSERLPQPKTDYRYVILYTSGSTGLPKGVVLEQHSIVNFCHWYVQATGISASDRMTMHAAFGFDCHMMEMFPALMVGATLYVIPSEMRLEIEAMNTYFEQNAITMAFMTTQVGHLFASNVKNHSLRMLCVAGEKLMPLKYPGYRVVNGYGPTEATVLTTWLNIDADYDRPNIGRPLDGYQVYVVDPNMRLLPRGATGELVICGEGVARGYLHPTDEDAKRFADCPFSPLRMYRTGDLVRWADDRNLDYLGRIDNQVKLRGLRIEMGEIETCASRFEGIRQVAAQITNGQYICLYYTADADMDVNALKQYLTGHLAAYMIPTAYMQLDAMPLNANGKVDRRRLPEPQITAHAEYVAPQTREEVTLARLTADVLSWREPISTLDSFFALGGDSIKLISLVSMLRNEGYTAQVSELMQCSTLRDMASILVSCSDGPSISQEPFVGAIMPGAIQQRFLSWHLSEPGRFTQSVVLRALQPVDASLLQQALQALAVHHDMLRASVVNDTIVIRPTDDDHLFAFDEITLQSQDDVEKAVADAILREGKLIDLEHGPILRAVLLHAEDGDRLLMVCHHIAVDGVSWRIMTEDLTTAMTQLANGQTISLPPKTHVFGYWTGTISRYRDSYLLQAEKPYWQQVQGLMEGLDLTTAGSTQTRHLTATLEGEPLRLLLTQSAKAYNTEVNDLLITALCQSYHRLTGSTDLAIQMEGHGREPLHEPVVTDRTVGWFTSVYPIVIQNISGDVRHDVRQVKELLRTIPNKGIGYGILQYVESKMGDTMLRNDLTPLLGFNYLGNADQADDGESLFTTDGNFLQAGSTAVGELGIPLPSIDINCAIVKGRFVARFEYDVERWTSDEAQQLSDGFIASIAQVAEHTAHVAVTEPTASDFGAIGWTEKQFQNIVSHFADRGEALQRVYPLTPMQEGMLLSYLSDRYTTAYRLLFRLSMNMLPTEAMLRHTLDYLAEKHEVLRTAILYDGVPQPCQAIVSRQLGLEMPDLTGESDVDAAAARIHQEQLHRPLSLTDDPLFRLVCMKTGDDSCQLLVFMHHVITDGWSTQVIFRDFLMKMEAETSPRTPVPPHPHTPALQHPYEMHVRQLLRRDRKTGLAYWKNLLADYDTRAAIPSYGRPTEAEAKSPVSHTFDKALTASLRQLAASTGVTLNTVMELGWGLMLQSFCRTEDAVFVKVVSGRDNGDNSRLVGLFINSVPVRVRTASTDTVIQSLQSLQEQAAQSASYDFCSLSEIQAQSELGSSLFQSVMAFENYPLSDTLSTATRKWDIKPVQIEEEAFGELSIAISPGVDGTLQLKFIYDTSLYGEQQMRQVAETFETIVRNMAAMSDRPISELPLITEEAKAELIELGTGEHLDIDPQMTFVKAFEQRASLAPDNLAVADATDSLTYGELSHRSNILAHKLIESGVKPGDFVAVMLPRTIAFPLAVIAIHKAGAAYVPIDLDYPEERKQYMLDHSQAKLVIDSQFLSSLFTPAPPSPRTPVEVIDLSTPDGLAYMIYTSGSTGRPKGVMIRQANLWNFIQNFSHVTRMTAADRVAAHRSFSFDAHLKDLYSVLTKGGSLHIMPEYIRRDLHAIRQFIIDNQITVAGFTTTLGMLVLDTFDDLPIRLINMGGERLHDVYSDHVVIVNCYGPTECTDDIFFYRIEPGQRFHNVPVGRPVSNGHCFLVDPAGRLVPRGAVGELCFAGVQVASGYWRQPELTAEKFTDCPFLPPITHHPSPNTQHRMYHTGDLCRWNADGLMEYVGRKDDQVKLRGFRIEFGEVESRAAHFDGISQAVAVVKKVAGSDTLCLYYTADNPDTAIDADELRRFMAQTLAEYMVPAAYTQLEVLPRTLSGKVDRRQLPEPHITTHTDYVAPQTKAEEALARLMADILSLSEPVSMNDSFFALGGDSIKLIRLVTLLRNEGFTAQVSELMQCNTVADMARILVSSSDGPLISQDSVAGAITPGAIQQRFLSWHLPHPGRFTQSVALRALEPVDAPLLQQALQALAVHHDMLRATVSQDTIVIRPTTDDHLFAFEEMVLKDKDDVSQTIAEAILQQGELVDLEHGPILRAVLLHAADGDRLLMVCHHIAVDGVSWRIMTEDLTTAMTQLAKGQTVVLPTKTHAFGYWTNTIARYRDSYMLSQEKPYWQRVQALMDNMEQTRVNDGKQVKQHLRVTLEGEPLRQLLTTSAKAYNTEINDLLVTALCQSYHRLTGSTDLAIQMEGHGREPLHEPVVTDRTVGWFTSVYPVVIQAISGDIRSDVRHVKEQMHAVPNKGIGYGILQYIASQERLRVGDDTSGMGDDALRTDLTPLMGFNYLGEAGNGKSLAAPHSQREDALFTADGSLFLGEGQMHGYMEAPIPSVTINCAVVEGRFVARFDYDTAYWTAEKAQQLADGFVDSMAQVAQYTSQVAVPEPTASDFGAEGWTEQQFQDIVRHFAVRGETLQRVYPLTPLQEGMLISYLSDRNSTAYRIFFRLSMSMLPTEAMLRHTLDYLAEKHEVLRTAILYDGVPQPCQAIVSRQLGLEMLDLTSESDINAAAARIHQEQLHRPLSLTDDSLFRIVCMKTGDDSCQLLVFMHHIIHDGWCLPVIFRDFLTKLDAEAAGCTLPATNEQSGRYESFVRQLLRRDRKSGLAYWKALLADYATRAAIPTFGKPADAQVSPYVRCSFDKALTDQLRQLAANTGVTLNTVIELAWGLVLQTYCQTNDVVFARVVSGRSDGANSKLVGPFINSVPVRVHTAATDTARQALKALQEQTAQSAAYDFCPLSDIQSQTQLSSSLLQSFVAFENYPVDETYLNDNSKRNIKVIQAEEEPFGELALAVIPERDGTLRITFSYDTSLYGEQQMQQVADTFETIVKNMVAMPNQQICELPLITAEQQQSLVLLGTGKHLDVDPSMTFVKAFEQQARKTPDSLAVADATDSLTYGELSHRSNILAHRLIASGVRPGDFVAVMLDRTIAFPLAVIAIHKAGAAYVPIDLEYPEERQKYMLDDSEAKVVIDDQFMADTDFAVSGSPADNIDLSTPDGPAYMIYTSGSTGKPKGAVLHQAGLWSFIQVIIDMEDLTDSDRIALHRSFSFDAHVEDLFPVLTFGGSLHIIPSSIRLDLEGVRHFLIEHHITGGGYATVMGKLLLDTYDDLPMRFVTLGGERLTAVYSNHITIFNVYGPTECTVDTSFYRIEPGTRLENVPIGRPVANSYYFLTDQAGRLVPRGAVGELCFAGIQVGRGYWHQPELTAEKFCDCPFLPLTIPEQSSPTRCLSHPSPLKMYRTGDLCRWSDDGQMEYIGRMDNQVKIRGYRIELGEVESCASRFEGIRQAVAVIKELSGSNTLCLYYTAEEPDKTIDADELRRFMAHTLADYMVPTTYTQLDAMPLTPNGKIDRQRLPAVDDSLLHADYVAPESELEKLIVSGFEKVLHQEKISVNDDFVRLGGDSLNALKLVFSLGERGITVADVLSLRTPAAIARHAKGINAEWSMVNGQSVNLDKYTIESGCPLNNTQIFIYNDIVKFNKYDSYLILSAIPIDRKYSDEQIKKALDEVFAAHPVLTMHVVLRDGVPYMVKGDKPAVMKGSLNPLKILSMLTKDFDLYSSLARHVIVRIPGRCYLVSVIHHLISDRVSQNVFCRHFLRALEGKSLGFVDDHFLKIAAFHQEVKCTEQYAEMDKYIRAMLGNLTEDNYYRNPGKHGRPGYHKRELEVDREQVNRFTERFGITKNILFTAAMSITLSKLAGNNDVVFGFLDNGRDRFNNFEDIGLYINGMPIMAHADYDDLGAYLNRLSDMYYKLSQNSYFPFASLAQEFNIFPIILFQFFPDWITEDGKYDHLPQNETLINAVVSTQKDFMVEALVDILEKGNSYTFRVTYSGYYSRKMMKALAKTYKETLIQLLKVGN